MTRTQTQLEQTWTQVGREFARIFQTVLLLAFVGLILAIGFVWAFSSVFGEGLSRYPWHVVLWIDIAFVLVAALLSDLAEAPASRDKSDSLSWALASFVIAVGTLGSLGSHTGKVWRGVFEAGRTEIDDPTILSEIICTYFGEGCGRIYFGVTLAITSFAFLVALGSAFVLRGHGKGQDNEARAYSVFIVSAFLFGLYTIFNQKWDTSGPPLPPITWKQILSLGLIVVVILAFYLLVGMVVGATRSAARSLSRDWNGVRYPEKQQGAATKAPNEVRVAKSLLRATAPTALKWAIALTALVILLRSVEHVFAVGSARRIFDMVTWFAYLGGILLTLLVATIVINFAVRSIVSLARMLRAVLVRIFKAPPQELPPDQDEQIAQSTEVERRELERSAKREQARIAEFVRLLRTILAYPLSILKPRIARIQGLSSGGVAISFLLIALLFEYVITLPATPLPPVSAMAGKEALRPVESSMGGKSRMPPLRFSQASIDCSLTHPMAWARSEVDGLRASADSCKLVDDIACVPATIVVAGTASLPGPVEEETERARRRGWNLAGVLAEDFRRKCGENARVSSYVLNLGRYDKGPLLGNEVRQRDVIVLVSRGLDDALTTSQAVEKYAGTESLLAQYSECEFYPTTKGKGRVGPMGKLNCRSR